MLRDLGLLMLRVVTGGLLAGHGSQKLFGWFGGHGLSGTAAWLESMHIRPGTRWAPVAGSSEVVGGLLTALGLLHPIGPIAMMGPMSVAIRRVHWGRPIWATEGGAELPVTNLTIAAALMLTGPGRLSLDQLLGIRLPAWVSGLATGAMAVGIAMAMVDGRSVQPRTSESGEGRAGEETTAAGRAR